jgi:hypothetical protein
MPDTGAQPSLQPGGNVNVDAMEIMQVLFPCTFITKAENPTCLPPASIQ